MFVQRKEELRMALENHGRVFLWLAGGPSCIIPPGRDRVPTLRAGCPRTALMGYLCNVTCEMPPGSCTSFELKEKAPRVKGR